ncbi:serine/threonine-protein kinase [Bacillus sp. NPDC057893]|uniref:serine/threonine-protein kinase n=1 Tax=Bacillus sp. NPDC057893 TaxID=3346273 RepID=UPI00366DB5A8
MNTFLDQHPQYKFYKNGKYCYMSELPYEFIFFTDFKGFIHYQLSKYGEDMLGKGCQLYNSLAADLQKSPIPQLLPLDDIIFQISQLFKLYYAKGFPSLMDALAKMLIILGGYEELNVFLDEIGIGYTADYYHGEVKWYEEEETDNTYELHVMNRLEYISSVGAGYFAEVHKYKDKDTGIKYALKRLKRKNAKNKAYVTRFKTEVSILQDLKGHSNIVSIIDSDINEEQKKFNYLMPLLDTDLKKYIEKNNGKDEFTIERRLEIFTQILSAMKFAHEKGKWHRDLSPRNVLLGEDQHVYVCDFGLGKDYDEIRSKDYSYVEGYGTLEYVAPEQKENLKNATEKSDIYSLGRLLYFILTGKTPNTNYKAAGAFEPLIKKAAEDEPEDRFETISLFEEEYKKLLNV